MKKIITVTAIVLCLALLGVAVWQVAIHFPDEDNVESFILPGGTSSKEPEPFVKPNLNEGKDLAYELPLVGATAYAAVKLSLYETADFSAKPTGVIASGSVFCIKEDAGKAWKIETPSGVTGYINNAYTFINLPDLIPSIVYNITNAYSSIFQASGVPLPGVTGEKMYDAYAMNPRLGRGEYIAMVAYPMAKRIYDAQQAALADGNTLVIYEAYRPSSVQDAVKSALYKLEATNETARKGMNNGSWGLGWFIATGVSSHQYGCAIDVSLAKITEYSIMEAGSYQFINIVDYQEYEMPSAMHELSTKAVSMKWPVSAGSTTAWKDVPPAEGMTEAAFLLRKYCTDQGMSPLASEWWHFNDWYAAAVLGKNYRFEYKFNRCVSTID